MVTRAKPATLVIAGKGNQLANRLFVYAHAMGWSIEHGATLLNPMFGDFAEYFEGCRADLLCRYPSTSSLLPNSARGRKIREQAFLQIVRVFRKINTLGVHIFPVVSSGYVSTLESADGEIHLDRAEFLEIARRHRLLFLEGPLFRDFADTARHIETIRTYFTPIASVRQNVARHMAMVREDSPVVVGVHVRRGDYRTFVGGKFYYEHQQYSAVMHQVVGLFDDRPVRFVLCSNEPVDPTAYRALDTRGGPGHPIEDLYTLASCDYIIGPPSTFSAWGSFYGNVPIRFIDDPMRVPVLTDFNVVRG